MDPERVAAAVRGCPAVAGLSSGQFGEVASYLPNLRIEGVRTLADDELEVHVVLWYGIPVEEAVAQVRAAVRAVAPDVATVHVAVADLAFQGTVPGASGDALVEVSTELSGEAPAPGGDR